MIIEVVTFDAPKGWGRARTVEDAKHTIPKWSSNKDLVRKHFMLGIGEAEGTGGGVYIWPSVEAAQAAHDEEWRQGVIKRTGTAPTIRYYDFFLMIDNQNGSVTEWTEDGRVEVLETA
jgi:hypothetical protein